MRNTGATAAQGNMLYRIGLCLENGDAWERQFDGREVPEEYRIMSYPQPTHLDPEKVEMDAAAPGQRTHRP